MTTWTHEWTSPELEAEGERAALWAARTLAEVPWEAGSLHVATPDGGAREALAFWRAAQETGYAFAAPAAFPWTLSNSPTGRISRELAITGPCTTYVGGDEAVDAALAGALADVRREGARSLVVWLRGDRPVPAAGGPVRLLLAAVLHVGAGLSDP